MFTYKLTTKLQNVCNLTKRFNSSALFISGDKAHETFVVLTPHIDFEKQDIDKIEESIKLRGLKIDVNKIINNWIFFRKYQNQKLGLEEAKANIGKKIKSLNSEKDKAEIEKLIAHGKMIKNDLSIVKDYFYPVQETAYIKVLSLPNLLHPNTPLEPTIIHTFGNISKTQSDCHTEIGKNLIEFQSSSYYLKNEAALFELASTFYFTDKLLEKNFTQFSNSDFTRSVIVEGCGIDFSDPKQIFTIMETDLENKRENSRLHLSGGASLAAFLAYHTKHTVFPSLLPLKYFTIGRQYNPVNHNLKTNTLLNISQETAVEIFVATKDDTEEMNLEFGNVLKIVQEIYDSLGYHYQICYLPPKCLKKHESLHASIQMYSPFLQNYVEVGHLSICDDYISKRLLFNYGTGRNINFPRVLSGTLFSVPKILACVIENDDKSLINDSFKKYIS